MPSESKPEQVTFRISARTARMLGRENISNAVVGIAELVRNAYDADATNVLIEFVTNASGAPELRIHDNGVGMSRQALDDGWLLVGTADKEENPVSARRKRTKVGNKGIGRLALDRLGETVELMTQAQGMRQALHLQVDWRRYDDFSKEFQEIEHPLRRVPKLPGPFEMGTSLIISNLRDEWDEKAWKRLIQDLSLLVPPGAYVKQFKLDIKVEGKPELSGPIQSQAAKYALYTMESTLEADGRIVHAIQTRGGEPAKTKTVWKDEFPEAQAIECGPLRVRVLFFVRSAESYKTLDVKLAEIEQMLDNYHGVRIYRDGFRVKPYGDPGGTQDWLGLNQRKASSPEGVGGRKGAYRIQENQVIGTVLISGKFNAALRDQTNREGLFHNEAFEQLRTFAISCIGRLESKRQSDEQVAKQKRAKKPDVIETVSAIAIAVRGAAAKVRAAGDNETARELQDVEAKLVLLSDQHQELQSENQLLMGLATLGIAMATFGHETQEAVNQIYNRISPLREILAKLEGPPGRRGEEHLAFISDNAGVVRNWGQFALEHVRRDKRTRGSVRLDATVRDVMKYFGGTFSKRSIRVDLDLNAVPKLSAFPMDVEAILINFITNSLEAMNKTPLDKRFIKISTAHDPVRREITMEFADGGRGIPPAHMEQLFDPFFTTKVDARGTPVGTGLGLTIVKKIVEDELGGSVTVVGRESEGGAKFTVRIPLR